jgi:DNA-binding MarR family transcriptional regulator
MRDSDRAWTFLSNHGHVLMCIAATPDARLRQIAERVGITERATQRILGDLVDGGYVSRARVGRRNSYTVNRDLPLRHPVESHHTVGDLIELVGP